MMSVIGLAQSEVAKHYDGVRIKECDDGRQNDKSDPIVLRTGARSYISIQIRDNPLR